MQQCTLVSHSTHSGQLSHVLISTAHVTYTETSTIPTITRSTPPPPPPIGTGAGVGVAAQFGVLGVRKHPDTAIFYNTMDNNKQSSCNTRSHFSTYCVMQLCAISAQYIHSVIFTYVAQTSTSVVQFTTVCKSIPAESETSGVKQISPQHVCMYCHGHRANGRRPQIHSLTKQVTM